MTLGLVGWGMVRVAGTGVAPGAGVVLVSGMVLERGGRERGLRELQKKGGMMF